MRSLEVQDSYAPLISSTRIGLSLVYEVQLILGLLATINLHEKAEARLCCPPLEAPEARQLLKCP